jgi:release factor glutamine methyltransferase
MQDFETIANGLGVGRTLLANIGIKTAALDARLLLGEVVGLDHAGLLIAPERVLSAAERNRFIDLMVRRAKGEPVSRIIGVREFYGREFAISRFVLDPRPDTETLIEMVLARHDGQSARRVVDLGAGSGAIIVTLLAERPNWTGFGVDISPRAIDVTEINANSLGVSSRLTLITGSWFDTLAGNFDLIVSNPPYIAHGEIAGLAREVREHDPHLALDGGKDGLVCYRAIAAQAGAHLSSGGEVIVEIGAGQQEGVTAVFSGHGLKLVEQCSDLGGHVRALAFSKD